MPKDVRLVVPYIPSAPREYDYRSFERILNSLRLYFELISAEFRSNLGDTEIDGSLTVNHDFLEMTSLQTDGAIMPVLSLYRNSSSPAVGDNLGGIRWFGENASDEKSYFAQINTEILTTTDGNTSGEIQFSVAKDFSSSGVAPAPVVTDVTTSSYGGSVSVMRMSPTEVIIDVNTLNMTSLDTGDTTENPVIELYRKSGGGFHNAADGDELGAIRFFGVSDNANPPTSTADKIQYASIYCEIADVSAGTEDGSLMFSLIANGSAEDPVMTLTVDGLLMGTDNDLFLGLRGNLQFEGDNVNDHETTLYVADPTQDNTVLLPDASGTVITTGNLSGITSVGDLSQDVLKVISTDAGAVEKPILALYRNSASVAVSDEIGAIEFRGNDGSGSEMVYANIYSEISVIGSGSEQAHLNFGVRKANGFEDPVMRIRQYAVEILDSNTLDFHRDAFIKFEGSNQNSHETSFNVVDPTQDNTILLPNNSGVLELGALGSGAVVTGTSIAHAVFTDYRGQKVVFTGSSNCTIQLPDVAAGDVGATWTVCNAGSANVIFDLNGSGSAQTLKILTGAAVTTVGTDDPHIIPGGVASLVCTAADNYILFGSGVVDN